MLLEIIPEKKVVEKIWSKDFTLLFLANLLMGIAFYSVVSMLPIFISDELNVDKSIIGIVLSMYTIAALLIRPFSGVALDSFGRKSIFMWAFLIFALLFGLYNFLLSVLFLCILRFMHGLTWGISSTSSITLAVDLIPSSRRGEGISYFGFSMAFSMAIGPAIGLFFVEDKNYNSVFIASFIVSIIGFILLQFIKYPLFIPHKSNRKFKWRNLIEAKSFKISLNILIPQITYGGLISFVAIYGKEIGIANMSLFFMFFATGKILGRLFSGKILDREGPQIVVTGSMVMIISGYILLALMQNYVGFLSSGIILGLGYGIIVPSIQTMVNNIVEMHRRGAANSTYFTIFDLGLGLGMVLFGEMAELTSISNVFLLCSGICVFALINFLTFTLKFYEKNELQVE